METELKKINLSSEKKNKKFFSKILKSKFFWPLCILFVVLGLGYFFSTSSSTSSNFPIPLPNVFKYPLQTTDNRVNVLLLGNSGGKHDGPYLTDSIIVASYSLESNKVTLISIPRDLWLDSTKSKVNAVYEVKAVSEGDGLTFAREHIGNIVGFPIHYAVRVDFNGFIKAIDQVGGVDVEVPKTFDDYNYPITGKESDLCGLQEVEMELNEEQARLLKKQPGKNKVLVNTEGKVASSAADFACRFEHIHYDKGLTHLDGEEALKFVRSRMGTNGEGSDFARSRRQQLLLQAFRAKVLSAETLFNPGKITGLIDAFGNSVETDIPADKSLEFYKLLQKMSGTNSVVLGDLGGGKSILINPPASEYGGAYVLIPPKNDFTPVKEYLKVVLASDSAKIQE